MKEAVASRSDRARELTDHSVITGAESVLRVDPVSGDRPYVAR